MRIGIIAESFPPDVNGVANSVLRVAEYLLARGHEPLVIAPQPTGSTAGSGQPAGPGYPVRRVPSVPLPGYQTFRLGLGFAAIRRWLTGHRAEVVHLASPFLLGARGMVTARQLRLPTEAVYQTDVPGYARAYQLGAAALARAAARLVADPRARAAQGRAARQRVLARSWAAAGDALVGHYAAVLAGSQSGPTDAGQTLSAA